MPKFKFSEDHQVQAEDGPLYKEGDVHEMPESSGEHFRARGKGDWVRSNAKTVEEREAEASAREAEAAKPSEKKTVDTDTRTIPTEGDTPHNLPHDRRPIVGKRER